ncbi:MAG: hypothetical protein ACR2FS_14805 [Phormidesmis sp.]
MPLTQKIPWTNWRSLPLRRLVSLSAIPIAAWIFVLPAIAQENAEPITLSEGTAQVRGVTAGDYSLTALAGRDRRRRLCLGYGSAEPNHTLVLSNPARRLQVAVESGGDTTLLIQGPQGIDCNDNPVRNQLDAAVDYSDWPKGTYRIWVGSFSRGDRLNYTLRISEPTPSGNSRR